ncbi:MAG: hypothetical protein WCC41_01055, partial [Rhodomicrobium sp.]
PIPVIGPISENASYCGTSRRCHQGTGPIIRNAAFALSQFWVGTTPAPRYFAGVRRKRGRCKGNDGCSANST